MAAKHPVKTTTNAVSTNQPSLPSPEVFDILPHLHELLARVNKHESRSSPLVGVELEDAHDDSDIACIYDDTAEAHAPLAPKDFQREVLEVKARIRAALREVAKLPDVGRSTGEQEEEIRELEERIRRQREMLSNLANVAKGMQARVP